MTQNSGTQKGNKPMTASEYGHMSQEFIQEIKQTHTLRRENETDEVEDQVKLLWTEKLFHYQLVYLIVISMINGTAVIRIRLNLDLYFKSVLQL